MEKSILQNILIFMERAQSTGKEAYAWVETHQTVVIKLNEILEAEKAVATAPVAP